MTYYYKQVNNNQSHFKNLQKKILYLIIYLFYFIFMDVLRKYVYDFFPISTIKLYSCSIISNLNI